MITFTPPSTDINIGMHICIRVIISYKYPIFPNKVTQRKLAENLDACRWLYNRLLQDLNEAKEKGIKLKTYDSQNLIPSLKLVNPKLNLVYNTLNYNQSGFKVDQDHGRLHLSKIGDMRIKIYRKLQGCIKAVIIKREGKRWFAIVQADQEPLPLPETGEAVGLDVGLASFVVDSEGNEIENPRCAEQSADKLAKLQRKIARAVRGSNNYKSLKDKIAKLHKRINCPNETIFCTSFLGCTSTTSISFVSRILMSKA